MSKHCDILLRGEVCLGVAIEDWKRCITNGCYGQRYQDMSRDEIIEPATTRWTAEVEVSGVAL